MKLFTASEIADATGEAVADVRARLTARVLAGLLRGYVIVPVGEPLDSPTSILAFEVVVKGGS